MLKIAEAIWWFLELIFGGANAQVALDQTSMKYDIDRASMKMYIQQGGHFKFRDGVDTDNIIPKNRRDTQGRFIIKG